MAALQYEEIKELEEETSFYEYEKRFEAIWLKYGQKTLEKSISKVPTGRRKKKINSRFGDLEIRSLGQCH